MKNLFFKIFFILIMCIGIEGGYAMSGGCYAMKQNHRWLKKAPMSMELYQYVDKHRETAVTPAAWVEMTKIIEQYIPIGSTPDMVREIMVKNHFECGTSDFKSDKTVKLKDPTSDEEFICRFNDFYVKAAWMGVDDNLFVLVDIQENKVVSYLLRYYVHGL